LRVAAPLTQILPVSLQEWLDINLLPAITTSVLPKISINQKVEIVRIELIFFIVLCMPRSNLPTIARI
jgi:hypothetical protein